ncbi:MAG: SDR family oxidoreductase [Planctomycetota bacterium]|nr:SDR family oxidoreductase [Planctomycetota bacterium]
MSGQLDGKVALVTGAGRGIGRAIAERLAQLGADVIVHDVHRESSNDFGEAATIDGVANAIRQLGRKVLVVTGDLTDAEEAERIVAEALTAFGTIHILVNNAGGDIAADGKGKAQPNNAFVSDADLHAVLNRNLLTTMNMGRAVAQHMVAAAVAGRIINISSLAGLRPTAQETTYGVAKAGVIQYTRCLAVQLRDQGINVNAIAPGQIKSARWLATIHTRQKAADLLDETRPLLRLGEPEDVANIVEFFVSKLSDYVTGEVLRVDGGLQTTIGSGNG